MNPKIYFTEKQRFNQWWLWLILLSAGIMPVIGIVRQLQAAQPFSDAKDNAGIFISLIVMAAVWALFLIMRLETRITDTGISVRFFPFNSKFQDFRWQEIAEIYVREYSALSEFGGWGIRYGSGRTGKAYNVSGNHGIQLVFKSGSKILIGTKKLNQVAKVLDQLKAVHP